MNSDLNSDCKQCTESKLGWVHSTHTQNPGGAYTARAVPRSWVLLLARQAGCARMRAWSRAQLRLLCLLLLPPSRPKAQVVTPIFNRPGRDLKSMSRPASAPPTETPLSRHHSGQSRSRPQKGVATPFLLPSPKLGRNPKNPSRDLLETNLCRDINFMSRPRFCPQWDFQVATSPTATHVTTSKMMS